MTDKRVNYRELVDPEYRRWGQKYPRFPGVPKCARLIEAGKARGAWADIILFELEEHARDCFPDLIDAFRKTTSERVRLFVIMALESAELPEAVPFLIDVLREGNPALAPMAERGLRELDTRESRIALWAAKRGQSAGFA